MSNSSRPSFPAILAGLPPPINSNSNPTDEKRLFGLTGLSAIPQGTHRATNQDHLDSANWSPAPSPFSTTNEPGSYNSSDVSRAVYQTADDAFLGPSLGHANWPSAPSPALLGSDSTFDSLDWLSAPSQTLLDSHDPCRLADGEPSDPTLDSSSVPFPVLQDTDHFEGEAASGPSFDWSPAPLPHHQGTHTAATGGHFEPILGFTDGAIDNFIFPLGNDGQFGIPVGLSDFNFIGGVGGFGSLDNFQSDASPAPEMARSSGSTTQRHGTALANPSVPATAIAPNAVNALPNSDRIRCTHTGCSATFGRPGDFRRHMGKHGTPGLRCPVGVCNYETYRPDKLRDHQRKKHRMNI